MSEISSGILFTPGRSSYMEGPDNQLTLTLSPASKHRALIARDTFDADFHEEALFAGGFPGLAQNWPPEWTPAPNDREAHHMARQLEQRLVGEGWSDRRVGEVVKKQGDSSNSIGDVLYSIQQGFLDPNKFNDDSNIRVIDLVAGALHGTRFRTILSTALAVSPKRIRRVEMRDIYGVKATKTNGSELAAVGIAKEVAAIAITHQVMRHVQPGNIEELAKAEERFIAIADKNRRS